MGQFETQLTMSHLGLGALTEYALMVLFGNAHAQTLVEGTGIAPDAICDKDGLRLYPAYFMTHLKVPRDKLLAEIGLWEKVRIGCHVRRFGETILDSRYILGGDMAEDAEAWDMENQPSMVANNLIVVDATEIGAMRKVSVPKAGQLSEHQRLTKPPQALNEARRWRRDGPPMAEEPQLTSPNPFEFYVQPGRDAAPGHGMIFAKFGEIMDLAEWDLLTSALRPGLPIRALSHLSVLQRKIHYYGNCFAGERLHLYPRLFLESVEPDYHGDGLHLVSAARLSGAFEVYRADNQDLLALATVEKLLALPTRLQDLALEVKRKIRLLES